MNGFNQNGVMPQVKYRLPVWVIVITVIGLILALAGGYSLGSEISYIASYLNIPDGNGQENTKLHKLEFEDCIRNYESDSYYNEFDYSDTFVLDYSSNSPTTLAGSYKNDFTGAQQPTNLKVAFHNLTYYDVCFVSKNNDSKTQLKYSLDLALESGNMECAIFELEPVPEYVVKDSQKIVKAPLEIKRIQKSEEGTVQIYPNKTYVIVFAGENATGNYDLTVELI